MEEAEGVLGGGGGEADEVGVEVLEHLAPQRVDRPVALVDEDHVEVFRWDGGVVDDRQRLLARGTRSLELGAVFQLGRKIRLALEHRIEPLDRRDGHLRGDTDRVGGQPLDVIELGEPAIVVGSPVVRELLLCLLAEVGPVDEEQHATRPAELDEPVQGRDGQHGLAASRGHLDERARPVVGERPLEVEERLDLVGP